MKSQSKRGFTIWEILIVLSLLAVMSLVITQLFVSNFMTDYRIHDNANQISRMDSAIYRLRRDVWKSAQIAIPDPHSIQLGGVRWSLADDGSLTRAEASAQTVWKEIGPNWSFSTDGPELVITDQSPAGSEQMRLVSQVMLAGSTR